MMNRPKSLAAKLKVCDSELKLYVNELEKINLKLHKQIAKLQAQNVDCQHEITALKKQSPVIKVNLQSYKDIYFKGLSNEKLEKTIKELKEILKARKKPT